MRSEFEKLEEIANIFKIGNFKFNEDEGNYTGTKGKALSYLRGSWVMYQHQQSKVDELQFRIETSLDEIRRALNCVESTETECVLRELEQALKGGEDASN